MQAAEYLTYGSRGVSFSEYGPYWRHLRKVYTTHLLSISKMESFRPLRKEELKGLVTSLMESEGREVVNISAHVGLVIEKITYRMILGTLNKEMFSFKPCVQEGVELAGAFNIADYIPFMKALDIQVLFDLLEQYWWCTASTDGMSPRDVNMKEKFGVAVPRANPLLPVPTYRVHVKNF
ncbi:hypothetical protein IFM89_010181 [Coptis chinensis]|uniref:Cytochrome P450 n=1 Tax=Coptis chinensis TaxID=261450 RepID=A0A835GYE8_9MAGN|nr:hypothetical protein IFM89_010181 [Coptis chinensis]